MRWAEIYERLAHDRDSQRAWEMLDAGIRVWARADLWQRGWTVVDDVVAETSTDVVLAIHKARTAETFAGFVRGHYLNVRRRAFAPAPMSTTSLQGIDPPAPASEYAEAPEWRVLDQCLDALPDREREAVRLRYFEEAGAERIAAALAVTPGNARRIVFNGLAKLRQCARAALAAFA
jgi:RNA polymerase sigma factor (sigma-70 family)